MSKDQPTGGTESNSTAPDKPKRRQADAGRSKIEPQIGRALRSVYDDTVGEEIPREMLELLGKLQ